MKQEIKLIKKDKSPKIPGYTLVREDRKQPKGKENDRGGSLLIGVRMDDFLQSEGP